MTTASKIELDEHEVCGNCGVIRKDHDDVVCRTFEPCRQDAGCLHCDFLYGSHLVITGSMNSCPDDSGNKFKLLDPDPVKITTYAIDINKIDRVKRLLTQQIQNAKYLKPPDRSVS